MSARSRRYDDGDEARIIVLEGVVGHGLTVGVHAAQLQSADFTVHLEVRVERRAKPDRNMEYLEAAFGALALRGYWQDSCGIPKAKAGWRESSSCSLSVGYVVVREVYATRPPLSPLCFTFVCAAHANKARVQSDVLGVVLLPKARLDEVRRGVERRRSEAARSERA